jgi:hypothetical protein
VDDVRKALALQKDNPSRKIGEILVTLGAIDRQALFSCLREFFGIRPDSKELENWLDQEGVDKLVRSLGRR